MWMRVREHLGFCACVHCNCCVIEKQMALHFNCQIVICRKKIIKLLKSCLLREITGMIMKFYLVFCINVLLLCVCYKLVITLIGYYHNGIYENVYFTFSTVKFVFTNIKIYHGNQIDSINFGKVVILMFSRAIDCYLL